MNLRPICRRTLALAVGLLLVGPGLLHATDRLHPKVLAAFREVVAPASKSTTQIYCDGYRAALGAVVDAKGYIVTKSSELKGKVECQFYDGQRREAAIVGRDQGLDLAVLKVDAQDLAVVPWTDTESLPVGSWLATPTISRDPIAIGVVSVGPRKIPAPSGALGIQLDSVDQPARIQEVMDDSAAEKAGLQAGDVILKVNGKTIEGRQQLVETIRGYMPGQKVELLVKRDADELTIHATLGSFSQLVHGDREQFQNTLGGALSERRAGFASVLQHDSVLKPSECGGPIVDLEGKVVGINIARAGRVETFALPASLVREAVKKLVETHLTSASAEKQ
ncbi:MAG: PDZ domain-containing protein [Pirellulaceae bacterium]|nr:PDZ domain-containing protein [Pirellulaceae bacterium]